MVDMRKHIEILIAKSSKADNPSAAMQYAQAAANAANACATMDSLRPAHMRPEFRPDADTRNGPERG